MPPSWLPLQRNLGPHHRWLYVDPLPRSKPAAHWLLLHPQAAAAAVRDPALWRSLDLAGRQDAGDCLDRCLPHLVPKLRGGVLRAINLEFSVGVEDRHPAVLAADKGACLAALTSLNLNACQRYVVWTGRGSISLF